MYMIDNLKNFKNTNTLVKTNVKLYFKIYLLVLVIRAIRQYIIK